MMRLALRRRAFSLIELVVVMAIIGTLVAIAMPRYQRALSGFRAESAARRIVADLDYARRLARTTGTTVVVRFEPYANRNRYTIEDHVDPLDSAKPHLVELRGSPFYSQLVSADFDGAPDIAFDPWGNPRHDDGEPLDGPATIVVQSDWAKRVVRLDIESGKAVLE